MRIDPEAGESSERVEGYWFAIPQLLRFIEPRVCFGVYTFDLKWLFV